MIIKKAIYEYGFALPEQYQPQPLPEKSAGKANSISIG